MTRVSDYIADFIYKQGVGHVFMVSGGGMMFLSDGIAKHPKLKAISNHHEQACAMAAVSYAKYKQDLGVVYVTSGCGGTNTITGLLGAWQDSVPVLFISGQSKTKETIRCSGLALRQFGVQEADIIPIVRSLTKYATMITAPEMIKYHLQKSIYLAKSGRPGPVWLDIPLDIQAAKIDVRKLKAFREDEIKMKYKEYPTESQIRQLIKLIKASKRPIIIIGQGIRLAKAIPQLKRFIEHYRIPVVASRLGIDMLPSSHNLFIGRIGNKGDRPGNFALQNSDLVISIGSRLSVSSIGHEYSYFAREAKIAVVDIDPVEHKKNTVRIDLFINADAKKFFERIKLDFLPDTKQWVKKCRIWKNRWQVCLPEYARAKNGINIYYFVARLSAKLKSNSVVISDAGSAFYATSQGIQLKSGQRYIFSSAQAEMGYTLPACIGVSIARGKKEVIGITGDGSFQMNIQELQTIVHYDLAVKIFVWNNDGYLSIRSTQSKFCEGRIIGADKKSGVSFPKLKKIATAYGIRYFKVSESSRLDMVLEKVLNYPKAAICEVVCLREQEIVPSVTSFRNKYQVIKSKPLEDMYPFLSRGEFFSNMIVRPLKE